ncbi:MAG: HAMP domain-containing histidine kinase [Proteobacteria bacterium]|nr:HAMP domain-containing histidine kinase [Pseudomonadota bacterium]
MIKFLIGKMGLKTKLILTMTSLFILSSIALFIISQNAQKRLIQEMEENIDELTKAIQISVEKLTSEEQKNPEILKDLIMRLKKKGINEISILSESKEIIASTNPKKVGLIAKSIKDSDFLIKAELGVKTKEEYMKTINVPIIIGDEHYGYINIVMHMENLTEVQKRNFYLRLFMTLIIFSLGTLIIIYLADKYTKPVHMIVEATQRVSKGDLSPINVDISLGPEIKELVINFNQMIEKLKERKNLENKIKEMEHIYQIGQLSSAIAHEIKNPLNFINLAIDQVKDELKETKIESKTIELLESVGKEIDRINNMVIHFLEYGKPLKLNMEYLNLFQLFKDIENIIKPKVEDLNINIEMNIDKDINILGDKEKLAGCFINLFLNSIDSIKSNGLIIVNTSKKHDKIYISFKDSGAGIPDIISDKIFEPYFSSKDTGMGLGLAFTKKILLEHGGDIWLNKEYKKGAEFIITIPANI